MHIEIKKNVYTADNVGLTCYDEFIKKRQNTINLTEIYIPDSDDSVDSNNETYKKTKSNDITEISVNYKSSKNFKNIYYKSMFSNFKKGYG